MVKNSMAGGCYQGAGEKKTVTLRPAEGSFESPSPNGGKRSGGGCRRPLHLAAGGRAGHVRVHLLDRHEGVACVLHAVLTRLGLLPLGDEHRLLKLVVRRAHLHIAREAL